MRKVLLIIATLILTVACHKTATAPVPGSLNTFDAVTYRALSDAQAAINSFKADLAAGKVQQTPTIKTALNQAITDYNAANTLWQAYHASAGAIATAPLAAAINQLNTDVVNMTGGLK